MIEEMKKLVEKNLPGSIATPDTEDNHHFEITVKAHQFKGKSLLAQHRMVYKALGNLMQEIHALAIETQIGEE